MKGFLQAVSTLGVAPLIFFTIAVTALFPPILIILLPLYALGAFGLFYTPKAKPPTFDEWWDDNWKDFL